MTHILTPKRLAPALIFFALLTAVVFICRIENTGPSTPVIAAEKAEDQGEAGPLIRLRYAEFDPLLATTFVEDPLRARNVKGRAAYIIQFDGRPNDARRGAVEEVVGKLHFYIPDNAYLVQADADEVDRLRELPFVRWVGRYEPAFKLDESIREHIAAGTIERARYNIMVLERGPAMQNALADAIASRGGTVHLTTPEGFRLEASLEAEQLVAVAFSEDVLFIDPWSPPEMDMDIVRATGGANTLETVAGFRGEGVRGEVMDNGLRQTHGDFNSGLAPIIHNSSNTNESSNHGSSTYGIVFGRGTANVQGRGLMPEAQGIFADYDFLTNRYTHTARLVQPPYQAVFQSNSWGGGLTVNYTTVSAELDDILFINDILVLNSQSNAGSRSSRPQAWAKNVVSVGGIRHQNTAGHTDDRWGNGASHGPAADGRLKPDLAHYYDSIYTTSNASNTSYTTGFGGTSAATPITAGHFGLFYQMWHNGLFGNATAGSVFASRPHMSTAKAVMINTAEQWDMTVTGTDIRRQHQGFGRANVSRLYELRDKMLVVDEADPLLEGQSEQYLVSVPAASTDPLKITMVYSDPMGTPGASLARVNDLDLKVTAPDGTVYWGNNGLGIGGGMWSTPGGDRNRVDTVENVFIESPASGAWTVEVIAAEINQDGRLETPGVIDADFALVASGVSIVAPTSAPLTVAGRVIDDSGRAIGYALVTVTNDAGETVQTVSNPFGVFRFDQLVAGETYVVTVASRRNAFEPVSRTIVPSEDIFDLEFIVANSARRMK